MLKVLDLFCGAGGLSYGLELTGAFRVVGGIDHHRAALATFLRNHPYAAAELGQPLDILNLDPTDVLRTVGGRVDLIVGGPPCQGFSHAGPREEEDPRNRMVFEFKRFVKALKPAAFIMENVSGLLTTAQKNRGEVLDHLCEGYERAGYSTTWKVVNSADYRVPQRRKRLILIGVLDRKAAFQFPEPPCSSSEGFFRVPEPCQTVGNALDDLPPPVEDDPQLYDSPSTTWLQGYFREESPTLHNHMPTKHSAEMLTKLREQKQGTRLYPDWNHSWYRLDPLRPAPAVKENHRAPFVHHHEPRVTSARECARLQTFPDRFVFVGTKTNQLIQIGNAVPCLLAAHLGTSLALDLGERVPAPWVAESHPYSDQETRPATDGPTGPIR